MSFLKRVSNFISGGGQDKAAVYWLHVQCEACGETLTARIDLNTDLSLEYGQDGSPNRYLCRKTLCGSNLCFRRIEVTLIFNHQRKLIDREIQGGSFLDELA